MIEFKTNVEKIIAEWKGKPAKLNSALEKGFRDGLFAFDRHLILQQLSGRKGYFYGLNVFTGAARNSLSVNIRKEGIDSVGTIGVGSQAWYLKAHQHYKFDGYIKPKNAAMLTIPINRAARGRSAADFDLVLIKFPGGKLFLVRRDVLGAEGKRPKRIPKSAFMFVLKEQTYLPKRLYFFEDFERLGRNMIRTNIDARLKEAVNAG